MSTRKVKAYQIRSILRRDLEYLCEFDAEQSEQDLIELLAKTDTVGIIAECNELIVGYCIYAVMASGGSCNGAIRIKVLHVKSDYRRKGVASALVAKLASKLHTTVFATAVYKKLIAHVQEDNLGALNFYKSYGFTSKLVKNKFGDLDGIKMTYTGD